MNQEDQKVSKFRSIQELALFIKNKEKKDRIKLFISDSRTIAAARNKGIKKEINYDLKYYDVTFKCIHSGIRRSKSKGIRPRQSTYRQGCPFYMSYRISPDGQTLDLKSFVEDHNHDCNQNWDELKKLSKNRIVIAKSQMPETGSEAISSWDCEDDMEVSKVSETGSPTSPTVGRDSHKRIMTIIGETAIEGIRGIMELGTVEEGIDSDSESEPDEPPPKRPNLQKEHPSKQMQKRQLAAQWQENSKKKVEATEKVAEAINNVAYQLGRIADCFELYNQQTM